MPGAIEKSPDNAGLEVLADLKEFETLQEKKLETAKERAGQEISRARLEALKQIEKLKTAHEKKLVQAVQKEKLAAKKQAGSIFSDFKKSLCQEQGKGN